MRKLFAYLALLVCVLTAPLAASADQARTIYVDVSAMGWSSAVIHVGWDTDGTSSNNWSTHVSGTLVSGNIYVFNFEYGNLNKICFSENGTSNNPLTLTEGHTRTGVFTSSNTDSSNYPQWGIYDGALYTLNSSGGATITKNYTPPTTYYLHYDNGSSGWGSDITAMDEESNGVYSTTISGHNNGSSTYFLISTSDSDHWDTFRAAGAYYFATSGTETITVGSTGVAVSKPSSNNGKTQNFASSKSNTYKITLNTNTNYVYVELATATPSFSFDPTSGSSFTSSPASVTITPSNTTSWKYTVNGTQNSVSNGNAVTVSYPYTSSGTLTITATDATDASCTATATYTLTAPETWTVYAVATSAPYVWIWDSSNDSYNFTGGKDNWNSRPQMTLVDGYTNLYSYTYSGTVSGTPSAIKFTWGESGSYENASVSGGVQGKVYDLTNNNTEYSSLDAYLATLTPSFSFSPASGSTISGTTASVTITPSNTSSWWYKIGSATAVNVNNGTAQTVTIGDASATADQSITITCGEQGSSTAISTATYTLTYIDPSSVYTVYLVNKANYSHPKAYAWGGAGEVLGTWSVPNSYASAQPTTSTITIDGSSYTVYTYSWPTSEGAPANIKFHDSSSQTADFVFTNGYYYCTDDAANSAGSTLDALTGVKWYVVGEQFNKNYELSNKTFRMTPEYNADGTRTGRYYYKPSETLWTNANGTQNSNFFRVHNGTTMYQPNNSGNNYGLYGFGEDYSFGITEGSSANFYATNITASSNTTIWLDTNEMKLWLEDKATPVAGNYKLNVEPAAVHYSGSWDAWDANVPVVYITGSKLNDNRIQPDWEMDYDAATGTYTLKNVTLRKCDLTAVIFTKDTSTGAKGYENATCTTVKLYADNITGAEDGGQAYGKSYDLTYDPTTATLSATLVSSQMPYVGIVGGEFKQLTKEDTPNYYEKFNGYDTKYSDSSQDNYFALPGHAHTRVGWQETYILYDANGQIWRDLEGKCMYSSQWPPKNPIFLETNNGTESIELNSANLTFSRVNTSSGDESQTGSAWISELYGSESNVKDGEYANLSFKIGSYDGTGVNYSRYVVYNFWMIGDFKLWTGWSTKGGSEVAEWSYHHNWGHNSQPTLAAHTVQGVYEGQSDLKEDNASYYKTVELYIPTNSDGTVNSSYVDEYTFLYATKSLGEASIQAKAVKINGSDNNNSGAYKTSFSVTTGYTLKGYRIQRYDADPNMSDMTSLDPSKWTTAGTKTGGSSDYVVTTDTVSAGQTTITLPTAFVNETKELANGCYFYALTIYATDADGNLSTETVISNPFTIANYNNFEASVEPIQLVYIKDNVKSDYSAYAGKFLTYRPGRQGDYYVLTYNSDDNTITNLTPLTASTASELCTYLAANPDVFTWTARYYVRAFDRSAFVSAMDGAVASGNVESYEAYPVVHARNSADASNTDGGWVQLTSLNRVYGYVYNAAGSLATQTFEAKVSYTYTPKDATEATTYTTPEASIPSASITPTAPKPYGLAYTYSDQVQATDPSWTLSGDITVDVTSSVLGKPHTMTFLKDDVQTRDLDCIFSFHQPNVESNILKYYDIVYTVAGTNNVSYDAALQQKISSAESDDNYWYSAAYYHDTATAVRDNDYTFTIDHVHPTTAVYPIFVIDKVTYKVNKAGDAATGTYADLEALYDYEDLVIEAPNNIVRKKPSVVDLYFTPYQNPLGTWDWLYSGHKGFVDPGDAIGDEGEETQMTPEFYVIETFIPSSAKPTFPISLDACKKSGLTGTYLDSDGNEVVANEYSYYIYPVLVKHDSENYACNYTEVTSGRPADPFLGEHIGYNYPYGDRDIVFVATPVYVFEHYPTASMTEGGGLTRTTTASNSVRRANPVRELVAITGEYLRSDEDATGAVTTGIESVGYESGSSEAEYYNLQGIRVTQPVRGQIYVVRRGAAVTKELVK